MGIEEVVKVTITRGNKTITRAGFGTALILSPEKITNTIETYTSLSAVAAVYATSTSIYKFAAKLFGQERKPRRIKVGRRTALVAQVNTVQILNNADGDFTVTLDGVDYTFVAAGSTVAQIRTGLLAAINADTSVHDIGAANHVDADKFTLTAQTAGVGHSVSLTANLGAFALVANNGAQEDIIAATALDNDWYLLLLVTRSKSQILEAAKYIETVRKLYIAVTVDADVLNNVANNVAAVLKAKAYARTAIMYSGDQANGPEAAWAGAVLPLDAGSETWKFKALAGITPDDTLSDTQIGNLNLNFVNNYRTFAGFAMTAEGKVAANEYIDVIRFVDWLQAQMEEGIFALLISVPKIPYTDKGVSMVQAEIEKQLSRGVKVGGLSNDPAPEVSAPKVADIDVQFRQARLLPDMTFNATLAGAIHSVEVTGVVSV